MNATHAQAELHYDDGSDPPSSPRMRNIDGIEATRQIRAETDPRSRVLALTTFDLGEYVYRAMRAGASGFLLKDVSPADLVHSVRAVACGETLPALQVPRFLPPPPTPPRLHVWAESPRWTVESRAKRGVSADGAEVVRAGRGRGGC